MISGSTASLDSRLESDEGLKPQAKNSAILERFPIPYTASIRLLVIVNMLSSVPFVNVA